MKIIKTQLLCFILFCSFLMNGCAPVYYVTHISEIHKNKKNIKELTTLLNNDPLTFYSRLTLDTENLAHDNINLGFDHNLESGAYRFNDEIYFWFSIIKHKDIIKSFEVSHFIGVFLQWVIFFINSIYRRAGWELCLLKFSTGLGIVILKTSTLITNM